ncbi:MAG: ATP-grasp domain-containing protein [Actinomycetota bacterium]|nr:ATP-grasp domain-containing protein [Actinomycetota bacterium]
MKVLFTGGGGAGAQALWDLLGSSHELHFGDADPRRVTPVVPASRIHAIPMASDPGFVAAVAALCRRLAIDVLVPGVDEELLSLARCRAVLGPTAVLVPDTGFVEAMLDKLGFVERLAGIGVRLPVTARLDDAVGWDRFPAILKPRHGRGSRGVVAIDDDSALDRHRDQLGDHAGGHVVQELIAGEEYSVQVMVNSRGTLRGVFPAHVLAKRGITISAVGAAHPAVEEVCRAIHAAEPTPGCYNVQGIVDEADAFVPFEINPRVSTTLCLAVASGHDPLDLCFDEVVGSDLAAFQPGVRLERYWTNVLVAGSDDAGERHG